VTTDKEVNVQNRQIRAFIAAELSSDVKTKLDELQDELRKSKLPGIKWVNPSGIHLTLKFLGNIDVKDVEKITQAIEEGCKGSGIFNLEISGLGVFPNFKRPRVIWLGVGGQVDILLKLQKQIDDNLEKLGFPREKRPFSPHITLGRVRDSVSSYETEQCSRIIANKKYEEKHSLSVDSIRLMRSQLLPAGAVYSEVASVRLSGAS
jgi:2'-5' RNA ligase